MTVSALSLIPSHRETLIRTSFQSLQLVVTDFLPIMPCYCLQISVTTAAKFGLQREELNISLTAVGLLVRRLPDHSGPRWGGLWR